MLPLAIFATVVVGLRPGAALTRRSIGAASLAAAVPFPAAQALEFNNPFDPKVAGGPRGLLKQSDIVVPKNPAKPNTGIVMLRELFDGETPSEGMIPWLDSKLSPDFEASFSSGKVVQSRDVCTALACILQHMIHPPD